MTRDGDQAIRGSWLRAVSSLLFPPFAVHIFHRLEILFARSAAKLSRFEIFMNGSDTPTTLDPAAHRKGTAATPHQRPLSPPSPPPPSSSAIARDLRLVVKLDDACPCLFVRDPISSPPSSAPLPLRPSPSPRVLPFLASVLSMEFLERSRIAGISAI